MILRKRVLCLSYVGLLFFVPRAWPQNDPAILDEANNLVRKAQTHQELLEAAALFEILLRTRENAGLHYNLGNLYQRAGQGGPAILNYLRALRLDPRNTEVRHNLKLARKIREDRIQTEPASLLRRLAFWHDALTQRTKFWVAWFSFVLFWCLAALKLFRPQGSWAPPAIASFALFAALGGSLVIQRYDETRHPLGVVMVQKAVVRSGNGDHYPPAFQDPLHEGAEFRVEEMREVWLKIRVGRDQVGWVPRGSIAFVTTPAKN